MIIRRRGATNIMNAESSSARDPRDAQRREQADRWRAGLLDAQQAEQFERARACDPRLADEAAFGRELARSLQELPQLAARRAPRTVRTRRVRWSRVLAAGMLTAGLAGLSVGLLPTLLQGPAAAPGGPTALSQLPASPQMADAVQNLDFYEWLAAHPQALDSGDSHGNGAA